VARQFWIYLLASESGTLYLGVTGDLVRRVYEHTHKLVPGFSARYNVTKLVWFEAFPDARTAIAREKQVKHWRREKKEALIRSVNPGWRDLGPDIGL
jgi:putative endonuclease